MSVFDFIRAAMREPLLHFLLGGAGLFLLFNFVSEPEMVRDDEIIVTSGQVEHIVSIFVKTRQRAPTELELRGLIDDFIVEEVLYREAIAIGLEQNDTIVRRRLRQKMEFLLDDFMVVEPSDENLQTFLGSEPARYRLDARISFAQVYLGEDAGDKAATVLAELQAGEHATPDSLSASFIIPYEFNDTSEAAISAQFGEEFKIALFALEVGQWTGPVTSPFGVHLVRVDQRVEGRVPPLTQIRSDVERDWLADFRTSAQQKVLDQMRAKYVVTVEAYEAPEL